MRKSRKRKPHRMLREKLKAASKRRVRGGYRHIENTLQRHTEYSRLKKHIEKLWEFVEKSDEKLQDIEIHLNLLTRLLTTLCVEKFGMRVGVLKRLIKRVEKEAIRDSQILQLESLYKLPSHSGKHNSAHKPPHRSDPWDDIS